MQRNRNGGSDSWLTKLRTTTEIAELLQMKRSTVENYARRGLLPSIKLGRHRRFVQSDVEAALLQVRHSANGHSPRLWGRLQM
jgi:excisionase family DNA binding protein